MSLSDLPSDIPLGENFPEPNKDSDKIKSPEVHGSSPPAPDPEPKVSRPLKETRCVAVNQFQTGGSSADSVVDLAEYESLLLRGRKPRPFGVCCAA
ncbi:hypothetical protein TNCV_3799431 [Trichonephila clavipes]|nr:hypothetical protein TNCV_3799431 [Trichonephila clavipes]